MATNSLLKYTCLLEVNGKGLGLFLRILYFQLSSWDSELKLSARTLSIVWVKWGLVSHRKADSRMGACKIGLELGQKSSGISKLKLQAKLCPLETPEYGSRLYTCSKDVHIYMCSAGFGLSFLGFRFNSGLWNWLPIGLNSVLIFFTPPFWLHRLDGGKSGSFTSITYLRYQTEKPLTIDCACVYPAAFLHALISC